MIYKGVLCILLCWFCLSSIKLFYSYNSQPIPYGVNSASNRIRPSLSYIMSLRDVVIHVTCLHWQHFLFEIDIWLKTRYCRKSKAGQCELGLCKLKLYVLIVHTQISTRIDRERLYTSSWKLVALQPIFCFYYVTSFRRQGHSIVSFVRQEVVSVQ